MNKARWIATVSIAFGVALLATFLLPEIFPNSFKSIAIIGLLVFLPFQMLGEMLFGNCGSGTMLCGPTEAGYVFGVISGAISYSAILYFILRKIRR